MTVPTPPSIAERVARLETETLRSAMAALAHSAQADGAIERLTAIWAVDEGLKAADRINELTARIGGLTAALRLYEYHPGDFRLCCHWAGKDGSPVCDCDRDGCKRVAAVMKGEEP